MQDHRQNRPTQAPRNTHNLAWTCADGHRRRCCMRDQNQRLVQYVFCRTIPPPRARSFRHGSDERQAGRQFEKCNCSSTVPAHHSLLTGLHHSPSACCNQVRFATLSVAMRLFSTPDTETALGRQTKTKTELSDELLPSNLKSRPCRLLPSADWMHPRTGSTDPCRHDVSVKVPSNGSDHSICARSRWKVKAH